MALDPAISLQVRPPQFNVEIPQPLQQFGQVLTLQDLMTRGQMNRLALQQQQIEMKERQDYANALANAYRNGPATTTTPFVQPIAPITPPVPQTPNLDLGLPTTLPVTAPLAPSTGGGQISTAFDLSGAPAVTAPAPSLGAMMTTPPSATAPTVPTAPAPLTAPALAMGGPDLNAMFGGMDLGQFLARYPNIGGGIAAKAFETQNKQQEYLKNYHENQAKVADGLAGIARGVEAASDKPAAFNQGIYDAVSNGWMTPELGRFYKTRGYNHDDMQAFIERSDKFKDYHEAQKADIESLGKAQQNAADWIKGVNDQTTYTQGFSQLDPRVQKILGPQFSPGLRERAISWGVPGAELPKMQMSVREAQAGPLAAALSRSPDEFKAQLSKLPIDDQALFAGAKSPLEVMQRAQNPDKYVEEARLMRGQLLEAGRLHQETIKTDLDRAKFDAEYGPGTAESAAEQIYANPDSVREVLGKIPAGMYPRVQGILKSKYGMPIPVPLEGAEKQKEAAALRTQGDVDWIRNAMQNPNIANNVGALLGNLQNVEQATGVATGLTGADAQMAQEFRNRMRGLIVNEAGAMRSRGVSSDIINGLVQSSPRINMDAKMMLGALDGVEGEVRNTLDTSEGMRWGAGKARPPEVRGLRPVTIPQATREALVKAGPGRHQGNDGTWYQVNQDGTVQSIPKPAEAK